MLFRGLKANIAFNIAVFLLIAGFCANLVTAYIYHGILLSSERHNARNMLDVLVTAVQPLVSKPNYTAFAGNGQETVPWVKPQIVNFMVIDHQKRIMLKEMGDPKFQQAMLNLAVKAMDNKVAVQEMIGHQWHLTGTRYDFLLSAVRILDNGSKVLGACVLLTSFDRINQKLNRYQKGIFLYILINTVILTLIALFRIFKIYLRPVDRLVQQADKYSADEDALFAVRREDNELGKLSAALNSMLNRISKDKKRLKQTVDRLENANRSLKEAQREIVRAEKMASVGRLAAGIAHEIGNPIGIVLGYLELLKDGDLDKQERAEFLARAEDEIQRINRIIRQLLDLARPARTGPRKISVTSILEDMVNILATQPMMADISIESNFEAEHDQVLADEEQLRQVFLNLFLNAADAIAEKDKSGKGMIRISVRNTYASPEKGTIRDRAIQLLMEIQDNGVGISEKDLENVFDPFFSTKAPGKGTGLGLAVSYMIIEKFKGSIKIQSRVGAGSKVTVMLPVGKNTATEKDSFVKG